MKKSRSYQSRSWDGGQIIPPENFRDAYSAVKEDGVYSIADEVIGFGRMGECFWGFESQ